MNSLIAPLFFVVLGAVVSAFNLFQDATSCLENKLYFAFFMKIYFIVCIALGVLLVALRIPASTTLILYTFLTTFIQVLAATHVMPKRIECIFTDLKHYTILCFLFMTSVGSLLCFVCSRGKPL